MLLSLRNLKVGLRGDAGPTELVRGVSLDIDEGDIVGLVGESGSGKSLTALSVTRLLPAGIEILGGEILLNGVDLGRLSDAELHAFRGKQVGVIFQDPLTALNPTLSIGAQLVDVVRSRFDCSRGEARMRAVAALRSVGISLPEQRMRAYPHQLSGGMRQRVLIAMVVLGTPKLILADEPTTALDVTVQARIIRLLRAIQKSGNVAILFISHNLDLVAEFCDRVVVLYGGRIMEQGTSVQIVGAPRHPYTRALLQCIPRIDAGQGPLRVIPGQPPADPGSLVGCPFAARCARVQPQCSAEIPPLSHAAAGHSFYCWNPEPAGGGAHA
jgi:oligopeptide/dipeptide ABC transporter ATP-binding protein